MKFEIVMLVFPLILVGAILQFTPVMTRRGLFFGATVAAGFPASSDGRRVLRSYRWQAAIWTVAAIGLAVVLVPESPILGSFAPLLLLIAATGLTYWRKFHDVHTRYGTPAAEIRRASLLPEQSGERFDPRLWLPPFLVMLAAAFYLHLRWNDIPERFPVHWGADAQPNGWANRDWLGVYGTLLLGTGTNLLTLGLAWLVARLSRKTVMRHVTVRVMLVLLYPLTFTFVVISLLPLANVPSRLVPAVILTTVGVTLITVLGLLYWSYVKISAVSAAQDEIPEPQSDSYWKAGMFYFNPSDPAIFVSKRVGIGYTLNLANKWAWIALVSLLALVVLSIAFGAHQRT